MIDKKLLLQTCKHLEVKEDRVTNVNDIILTYNDFTKDKITLKDLLDFCKKFEIVNADKMYLQTKKDLEHMVIMEHWNRVHDLSSFLRKIDKHTLYFEWDGTGSEPTPVFYHDLFNNIIYNNHK